MRQRKPQKHHLDNLLALLLFGVFAVCVLSVLLTGADAYRRLTRRDQAAYESRTCVQYLATKVRQVPSPDALSVSSFGDGDALMVTEEIGGERYTTRIYCSDGWLRELFAAADGEFLPEDGERVLEAEALELALEDGLLSIRVTDGGGNPAALTLSVRGGEGDAP